MYKRTAGKRNSSTGKQYIQYWKALPCPNPYCRQGLIPKATHTRGIGGLEENPTEWTDCVICKAGIVWKPVRLQQVPHNAVFV